MDISIFIKFTNILPTHIKTHMASMNCFDSEMYNNTDTVVYIAEKGGKQNYVRRQSRTQFMLSNSSRR